MPIRQALPYLAALLLLAWILGSLARAGTEGTSILANSYWLLYIVYLLPFFALMGMVAMIVYLVINMRVLSDALGWGMAQKRRKRRMRKKTSRTVQIVAWVTLWAIAVGTLLWKCGTIPCQPTNSTTTLSEDLNFLVVNGTGPIPTIPGLTGVQNALGNFVGSEWFGIAFLGLLAVSSVIIARSIKVSMDEIRHDWVLPEAVQQEGTEAVVDALAILKAEDKGDPRTRIMACYERMIRAAASLGADVSVHQTARELETGIRHTFQLRGEGIAVLTRLFEEARFSLHVISEAESGLAEKCLLEIGDELKATPTLEN